MSSLIGPRHGKSRETYPVNPGLGGAVSAMTNRGISGNAAPAAFEPTGSPVAPVAVAYANVTRRASGLFVVGIEMGFGLSGADTVDATAVVVNGSSTGGTAAPNANPAGSWFVETASSGPGKIVVPSAPTFASDIAVWVETSPAAVAGLLDQTVVLIGVNSAPLPVGDAGTIYMAVITASGATTITPGNGAFTAFYFELP